MNDKTILSIYCCLKPNQMQEGCDSLFQMVNSLKSEIDSDFLISCGSPSNTSNKVSIYLSTKAAGASFDANKARKIAETIFKHLRNYKKSIDICASTVVSLFPLCDGDIANEDNEYTYTLEEVLLL